jgi:formate-nitrite transporter family protein
MAEDRRARADAEIEQAPKTVEKPETGTRLSAVEIHDNVLGPALEELERPASSLLWSAVAAGLTIGFSFLAGAFLAEFVPAHLRPLAQTATYPIGFVLVIFARNELFTENTLEPVIPLLHRRDGETLAKMLRIWGLLLLGNLVGCAVFALVVARTGMVEPSLHRGLEEIAREATTSGFGPTFYRAIFAGWLLAMLTWVLASTQSSGAQLALIWVCTALIAALEFKHSIVGSVEALYRVFVGTAGLGEMAWGFILPAVLGNAVGGVTIVALLNYGQVAEEHRQRGTGEG